MKTEKILIIDDEMYPNSESKKRHGRLKEEDLAIRLKNFLEKYGFQVDFYRKGEDAIKVIKDDKYKEIKIVFLDLIFDSINTKMQGLSIFREIARLRSDISIVIITALDITKSEGVFQEACHLGASLFILKKELVRRGNEQINYIEAIARRKKIRFILKYREAVDDAGPIVDLDIFYKKEKQRDELSILKNTYRINNKYRMRDYLIECINKRPNVVHWKSIPYLKEKISDRKRDTSGVSEVGIINFHKAIHKLNLAIRRSSSGRIPALIERRGWSGCKLSVNDVKRI